MHEADQGAGVMNKKNWRQTQGEYIDDVIKTRQDTTVCKSPDPPIISLYVAEQWVFPKLVLCFFTNSVQSLHLKIFRGIFFVMPFNINYSSNSTDEPLLCLDITDNLAKRKFKLYL